jgi:hypothetical protein
MGSDMEFIVRGRSFIHTHTYNEGLGLIIDCWGIPCFNLPQLEKTF